MSRPRDVLGTLRTVLFAPEDLAPGQGRPGGAARFLDDLLVAAPAPLGRGAVRLRQDPQAAQRPAEVGRAGAAREAVAAGARRGTRGPRPRRRTPAPRRCTPSTCGTPSSPRSAPSCCTPGCGCCATSAPTSARRTTRSAPASRRPGRLPVLAAGGGGRAGSPAGEVPEVEELRDEILASLAEVRGQEVERGVSPRRPAPRRPGPDPRRPAGQGVRQPRRVLVVRAGAEARGIPAAAARPR